LLRGTITGELLRLGKSIVKLRTFKISFSQTSEDLLVSTYLPEKKVEYLDIGAGHPVLGSNTFKYYLQGGKGTVVDPIHTNIQLFKIFRSRDKRIRAFVSDTSGSEINFFETFPLGYSSNIIPDQLELDKHKIVVLRKYLISQVQLSEILAKVNSDDPFLLSIDAEGQDLRILMSNDWKDKRPRVVISETLTEIDRLETCLYMESNDYVRVGYSVLSSVFVAREYLTKTSEINHFR
jgi:hypothetical protein